MSSGQIYYFEDICKSKHNSVFEEPISACEFVATLQTVLNSSQTPHVKMQCFAYSLLFLGVICLHEVSGQNEPTEEEKKIGLAIANKLNELMSPKGSGSEGSNSLMAKIASSGNTPSGIQYLDFQLLVDSSGSIGAADFEVAKDATNTVVDYINRRAPLFQGGSRAALIKFSSPTLTKLVFGFGDRVLANEVKNEISRLRYDSGPSTATALALSKAQTEFQLNPHASNAKVVWMFTDGQSNTGGNPVTVADQLKATGVTNCCVAIGSRPNMAEINAMCSGCVYQFQTVRAYKNAMQYALQLESAGQSQLDPGFFKDIKF